MVVADQESAERRRELADGNGQGDGNANANASAPAAANAGSDEKYEHEFHVSYIYRNWTGLIVGLLFYLLVKNWMSNLIVKRFSAVVKYVVYATAVVLTYLFESILGLGAYGFALTAFFGTLVVMQGVILFADAKKYKKKK